MSNKRPVRYTEAAEAVMKFNPADLVILTQFDSAMIRAQIEVVKLCASFESTGMVTTRIKLVNKSKTVAAWVEATESEVVCFAIGFSSDRGRTWTYPRPD